jgi:hypothetical protein
MRGIVPATAIEVLKSERRECSSEIILEPACLVEGRLEQLVWRVPETGVLGVILSARPGSKFIRGDASLANPLQGRAKK